MPYEANDPAIVAAIKAAVDSAIEEATTGLIHKNRELIQKNKSLAKGQEIDPKVVEDLETALDKAKSETAVANKAFKDLTKTSEATNKQLLAESSFTQRLLVENGLIEALSKNGVTNPVHQKAAVAMLKSGVQILAEGENRKAMFGDKELAIAVKEWATGDEGKYFVTATVNSGSSANGSSGGKSQSNSDWSKATTTKDRVALLKAKNPSLGT